MRCTGLMANPLQKLLIMGNHGVMIIGDTVADTFNWLFYFERGAETYIRALQTGQPPWVLPNEIAEKTVCELEGYSEMDTKHLVELKVILDEEGSKYAQ